MLSLPLLLGAAPNEGRVTVAIEGMRNAKGQLLICLTSEPKGFPSCPADARSRRLTVPAKHGAIGFDVPAGDWAVAIIHDENGNGKLDTAMGMPREGFAFSRNPAVMFGPPSFRKAAFRVNAGKTEAVTVRMKYML